MLDVILLGDIWLVGFGLNLLWEFGHCRLYETCRRMPWRQAAPLLVRMAGKDGLLIVLFYLSASWLSGSAAVVDGGAALFVFAALCLGFAFIDERISLRLKRWEYAAAMPTVGGVGVSPLFELAVTGVVTLLIIFKLS